MTERQVSTHQWDSQLYDNRHSFVWELAGSLVDLLAPQSGERILDLGSGTGALTAKIAESGPDVMGMDHSSEMVEESRRQFPELHFEIGDAHDFSYPEPFDAIFSNAVLHWIQEPEKVVRCVSRALKPQGRFVVEFGGRGNVGYLVQSLERASEVIVGKAIAHPWYFPSVGSFASLLEEHGLEVTQAALFDRPTPLEGEEGLRNWVKMFGGHWLNQIPEGELDSFFVEVEKHARPHLYENSQWHADYRRLRIVAVKERE